MNSDQLKAAAEKSCTKCKTILPATLKYFYKDSGSMSGLHSQCKPCRFVGRNKEKAKRRDAAKYLRVKYKFVAREEANKKFGCAKKYSCAVFGCNKSAEQLHHVWYQAPLDVVPMCRLHHMQNHQTCADAGAELMRAEIERLRAALNETVECLELCAKHPR